MFAPLRRTSMLALALGLALPLAVRGQAPADVVTVTVQGEGLSADAALKDALRRALEQGGQQEISSHTEVENFTLIRDTIYARADGIVSDFRVLEQGPAMGGTFFCRIEAQVRKSAIATNWGEVQNVLEQIGRPGIAVYIVEKIDDVPESSSILESKIEERLIQSGFDVYDSNHLKARAEKELADAVAEDDIPRMQAIAKSFGTQIFITGAAGANQAGVTNAYGENLVMYNCDVAAKMYYTDTGKLIASESLPQTRGGARGQYSFSPQAAKQALSTAGAALVEKIYATCLRNWATRISAGDTLELEVTEVRIQDALELKRRLGEIPGVRSVNYTFSKGLASFRIQAALPADALVEQLVMPPFATLLEVVDVQMNRIQAKAKQAQE